MEIIIYYLIEYFSDIHHILFWSTVLIVVLCGFIDNRIKNNNKIKIWMKKHNIGKKYW